MDKKKVGVICIVVILVGIFTGIWIFVPKWNRQRILTENLELASRFLLEEDYEAAIVAFTKAIETDPKCAEAYTGLADVYLILGDDKEALEVIEKGQMETGDAELFAPYLEQIRSRTEAAAQLELTEEQTKTVIEDTTQPAVSREQMKETELSDSLKKKTEILLKFLYYEEIGAGSVYSLNALEADEKALLLALCMSEDVYGLCTEQLDVPEYSQYGIPAALEENANQFLMDCIGADLTGYSYDGAVPLIREGSWLGFSGADWGISYPFAQIEGINLTENDQMILTGTAGWMGENEEAGGEFTVIEETVFEAVLEKSDSQYLDGYTLVNFQYRLTDEE